MMVSAAHVTRVVIVPIVFAVSTVSAFPQSNNSNIASLERTSLTAARPYDPGACIDQAHALIPSNLIVAPRLHAIVEAMLRQSATFRRQCLRIAQAPHMTVRVEPVNGAMPRGMRAHMRILRHGSQRFALVEIPPLDDAVELIAHEIEHVVEQLDGVDLRSHAARSNSSVRIFGADETKFETKRARLVGLLVAEEVRREIAARRSSLGSRNGLLSQRQRY